MAVSLFAAILVNSKLTRWKALFRTVYFAPVVTTLVAVSVVFKYLYHPRFGIINLALGALHLPQPDWLGDPVWAKICVILADAWIFTPFVMLVLYAALQTLDQAQIEAAKIDGAGGWRIVRHIVLPSLVPVIIFTVSVNDDRGLVPCVVQDWETGEVLTLAYMNADALERTRATGEMHL